MKEVGVVAVAGGLMLLVLLQRSHAQVHQMTPVGAGPGIRSGGSSHVLIETAYAKGELTKDQWALYQTYALFDRSRLPTLYMSDELEDCGTWIPRRILGEWKKLSEATRQELMRYRFRADGTLARPSGLDSTRGTPHFKFHYSVTIGDTNAVSTLDADGNGTPDYVDTVMTGFEAAWSFEMGPSLGYYAPPPDSVSGIPGVDGGDGRFDVYIKSIDANGITYPTLFVGDNPNSPDVTETQAYASYIEILNKFVGSPSPQAQMLQVVPAHELFHAVQNGYDVNTEAWMQEATSTWCQNEAYPNVRHSLNRLVRWFQAPWISLDADNTRDSLVTYQDHWYGSWIFFRYLSEKIGGRDLIRTIWDNSVPYPNYAGEYSFNEIGDALGAMGTDFATVFKDFTVTNRIKTVSPFDYTDAAYYPSIAVKQLRPDTTITDTLRRHASRYYWISPTGLDTAGLLITFTALDTAARFSTEVVTRTGNVVQRRMFSQSTTLLPSVRRPDTVVVIVMNYDSLGRSMNYRLQVAKQLCSDNPRYLLTEIGLIDGTSSYANKINKDGFVVGTALNAAGFLHAFFYDGHSVHDLDSLHPGVPGNAVSINNARTILGTDGGGPYVLGLGGAKTYINTTISQGPHFAGVADINEQGQVVGYGLISTNPDTARALVYSGGTVTVLRTLFDGGYNASSAAAAMNNSGGIVGLERDGIFGGGNVHPMRWQIGGGNGRWLDPAATDARDVNDNGVAAGSITFYVDPVTNYSHAALWQVIGPTTDIGTVPGLTDAEAYAINNLGKVVGSSYDNDQFPRPGHAFIWENGGMKDCNCLVARDTSWVLQVASDVNDSGQIVGWGLHNGIQRAFLLTPVGYHPVLPIELGSFSATVDARHHVHLDWLTLSEVSNYGFDVQRRSTRQQEFQPLPNGFVPGHGTTNEPHHYSFIDSSVSSSQWRYRLKQIDLNGQYHFSEELSVNVTSTGTEDKLLPKIFALHNNYPNPFNPATTIKYDLPKSAYVSLKVYDIVGREVASLVDGNQEAGYKSAVLSAGRLASGVYFYRLSAVPLARPDLVSTGGQNGQAGNFVSTKKLILLK